MLSSTVSPEAVSVALLVFRLSSVKNVFALQVGCVFYCQHVPEFDPHLCLHIDY